MSAAEATGNTKRTISHVADWPYIISHWDDLLANSSDIIIRTLRLGIPNKYRGKVWELLTNSEKAKSEASFTYKDVCALECPSDRIIDCDVPRTFPSWMSEPTENILSSLKRVLTAYANTDPELGYTQGMNFIAAMFLLYQDEETAFWSFYSMMHLSSIPHRTFFTTNFPKLHIEKEMIDTIIDEKFPYLSQCLKERHLDSTLFAPQWLMVCFLNAGFDLQLSAFIFDQFLAYGVAPLVSFGLTILDLHQNILQEQGFEELLVVLSNIGNSPEMKFREKVNLTWNKYHINSKQYTKRLKQVLEKQKNQLT